MTPAQHRFALRSRLVSRYAYRGIELLARLSDPVDFYALHDLKELHLYLGNVIKGLECLNHHSTTTAEHATSIMRTSAKALPTVGYACSSPTSLRADALKTDGTPTRPLRDAGK